MTTSGPSSSLPPSNPPPGAWAPMMHVRRLARAPIDRFLEIEAASGIMLFVAAALALLWANSPWGETYTTFWATKVGLSIGGIEVEKSLAWLVNDGLMVIFFFVVGLEIRREIYQGELSDMRRASLPLFAALGGVLAPALIYIAVAGAPETRSGWGVPMATDIAFALGIIGLLGKRVPPALRVLLLAVAVIDDLIAILVIAFFYTDGISLNGLLVGALGILGVLGLQVFGVRSKVAYIVPTVIAWAGIYAAGIHPTIAGVIVGLLTPVRAWLGPQGLVAELEAELAELAKIDFDTYNSHAMAERLRKVDLARREAMAPSEALIEMLHPWVAYFIMPVFALANAGVVLSGFSLEGGSMFVIVGVTLGLCIGKPVGIMAAVALTTKLGLAQLPSGVTLRHMLVLGMIAGVGFTMALFIAQLAFTDEMLLGAAKIGILGASGLAAVLGLILGVLLLPKSAHNDTEASH